jgi:hypothetical protein
MGVIIRHRGNFNNTEKFLKGSAKINYQKLLTSYGERGVQALASATPIDSGETASSWGYEVRINKGSFLITWTNANDADGVPVAILIQYGHGTRNGGYVQGRDYINPAMRPIFDEIANLVWREVTQQ